eukprot:m.124314 g.124314  ORF g.124314 m.124314 type:complete len:1557 (+) comp12952_c0_seq3:165-4835(+)
MLEDVGEEYFHAQVRLFSRFGEFVSKSNKTTFLLIFLGCVLCGGLMAGLLYSEEENDTIDLYTHSESRLHNELSILQSTFGLSRKEGLIFTSETGNIATVDGLESIVHTLTPIFREDESASCLTLDGDTTTVPELCGFPPYSTNSVYCICNKTSSSPNQITITYNGKNDNGNDVDVQISQKDVCESPEVPSALKPGLHQYIPAWEEQCLTSDVFLNTLEQTLQQTTDVSFLGNSIYASIRNTASTAGAQAFHDAEKMNTRSDFTSSSVTTFGTLVVFIGSFSSKTEDSAFDTNGLANMWLQYATNSSITDQERQQAYLDGLGGGDDGKKIFASASVDTFGADVLSMSTGITNALVSAFSAAQYGYILQGNVISHSYQAVASCVAEYTDRNRESMLDAIFDATVAYRSSIDSFLSTTSFNVSTYDPVGVAAAKSYLEEQLALGVDISTDTAVQAEAFNRLFAVATDPANAIIEGEKERLASSTFSDTGLDAALQVGINLVLAGEDLTTSSSEQAISNAYTGNGGSVSVIGFVHEMIQLAAPTHVEVNQRAATVSVEGVIANVLAPYLVVPETATVNGTLRPLPRAWGFDRFPCSRVTPVDVFSEGNFDLPLNMKFLEHISLQVASFFTQPFFAQFAAESNCLALHVTNPIKEAAYFDSLPSAASYQGANFDAFAEAESAYLSAIANGSTTAAAATEAVGVFLSNGGEGYTTIDPTTPVTIPPSEYTEYGDAISNAATAADLVSSQFADSLSLFVGFGYKYRPSFGDMSTGNITQTILSAINNTLNADVSSTDCVLGEVNACLLAWSARKVPPSVVFGETTEDAIVSGRVIANNWNENAPLFSSRMETLLNRNLTDAELLEIHLSYEQAVTEYLEPIQGGESNSGYGETEPFASESVDFTLERSVSDEVNAAGETNTELIICAAVILVIYTAFSAYNLWSSIFSHSFVAIWGLIVVVASTGASLGLASLGNLKFTPITTAVVPFLAIGIGIDDMFVILRIYTRECQNRQKQEGLIARVLGEAGPSVTLTSFTNLVAFSIAAMAPIEIVRGFALQMSINIFLNFVFLMIVFVPSLVWDAKRVYAGHADALIMCCHEDGRARSVTVLDSFFEGMYANVILSRIGRILIPIVFLAWFGIAFWQGFFETDTGLRLSQVANENSFVYNFAIANEKDFLTYDAQIITQADNFPAVQESILTTLNALQTAPYVSAVPSIASTYWLTDLIDFYGNGQTIPKNIFYQTFSSWLGATGTVYLSDMVCKSNVTEARVSCSDIIGAFDDPPREGSNPNIVLDTVRGIFYLENLDTTDDFVNSIESTRTVVDTVNAGSSEHSFVTGYTYVFWEQYLYTDFDLYFVVGLCLLGVFVATFFTQLSFPTTIIICVFVFMIDVEVFGMMNAWGIQKNAFSLVNLCLAIGMGVEFTAHIAHQFQAEEAPDRTSRARQTLGTLGTAMFHGGASSILATLFIAGSDTGFIREYYFGMFFATIIVAFLNGMVLLPVVLSFIGPNSYNISEDFIGDDDDKGDEDGANDFLDMATQARTAMSPVNVATEWGESDFTTNSLE